ncbi:unnamed protein product, partial [Ectocarpus sp. 13 AM-2016]
IRKAYEDKYGRSLAKTIEKKFFGKMEDALLSLLFDPIENFARGLKAAFHGLGTDKVSRSCCTRAANLRALRRPSSEA